jgi:neutral ceramidase
MKANRTTNRSAASWSLSPLALGAPLLVSCGPSVYALPAPTSCLRDAGAASGGAPSALEAAAVDVDITPPIGLSLFGHGLEGRIASGLLTHLGCRGFVFRKPPSAFAWVTCDLQSVSLALSRRVAELVRAETDLGADSVLLSATHTHAGPAHFSESRAYISAIGGSRDPSYDQQVVDFIARRVAGGIIAATRRMEPVEIRSHSPEEPVCVEGLSRNRAMPAFLRNLQMPALPCLASQRHLDPAHASVNREVTLLRIDRPGAAGTLGVMAVFAVHPTAISNVNERYHGDLFGFASRYCQDALEARDPRGAVCAIANGAEGDVSPDWAYQGELEARRLGARLGAYVVRAFDGLSHRDPDPPLLASRYRELVLPSARVLPSLAPSRSALGCDALTAYAEIGTPVGGGAPDGPTRLRIFEQLNQGMVMPGREDVCSRPRAAVLGVMPTNLDDSLAGYYFPVRVPIAWFRVGRQGFVTVPGEATTMAGDQLERAATCGGAAPADGADVTHTRVVGLSNGYISYIATAAEYEAQYYEGAETLYGKRTADFFEGEVKRLVCGAATDGAHPRCEGRPASAVARPGSPAPPYAPASVGDRNPNIPPLGVSPTQPAVGEVGALYISPDPVKSRWPKDLPVDKACWSKPGERGSAVDPRALVAPPLDASKPVWSCSARVPSLEVSWSDTPSLPLCGASIVTLLASRKSDRTFYVAHAEVAAPESLLPVSPGPPSADGPQPDGDCAMNIAMRGQFRSFAHHKGPTIDDEHGFVQIWFDDDDDRWHARFRAPEYIGWAREARFFRFAIKSSSGEVWATPPAEWSPYHPPCPMRDEDETEKSCVRRHAR